MSPTYRGPSLIKEIGMFIGAKVTVGAFVPDDYAAMYCWANDIIAARLDGAFRPVNLKDVLNWCESAAKDPTRVMLAIRQRTDPKLIGYLHIQNINAVHRSADIGIRIGEEKYRGQGYGKEALAIGLDYCWNHLNLERVGLFVFRHNKRAINAYNAVGFKKEGILRKLFFIDGAWIDVIVMAAFRPRRKRAARSGIESSLAGAPVASANSAVGLRPKAA
jgi:[ribosomal protein S5]-alanine N-acetyltransferase